MAYDLTEAKVEVVVLDDNTMSIVEWNTKANDNFQALKAKHNKTVEDVETIVNKLEEERNALTGLTAEERQALAGTINQLKGLAGSATERILAAQDVLADRINMFNVVTPLKVSYSDVAGVAFDLTAFGFEKADDYSVVLTKQNAKGKTVEIDYEPVDGTTVAVSAIDTAYVAERQKPYDPTTKGNFDVVGTLTYSLANINLSVLDMEGDAHQVGGE